MNETTIRTGTALDFEVAVFVRVTDYESPESAKEAARELVRFCVGGQEAESREGYARFRRLGATRRRGEHR